MNVCKFGSPVKNVFCGHQIEQDQEYDVATHSNRRNSRGCAGRSYDMPLKIYYQICKGKYV